MHFAAVLFIILFILFYLNGFLIGLIRQKSQAIFLQNKIFVKNKKINFKNKFTKHILHLDK